MVGLGNPEPKYTRTPHNLGFLVLDELERRWSVRRAKTRLARAEVAEYRRPGAPAVWLMAPLTYMNLSGEATRPFCEYYKIPTRNLVAICDDHDLPWGRLRIRAQGSAGGHNGLSSIRKHMGGDEFARLRIGIRTANPKGDLAGYVLSPFWGEGLEMADIMVGVAADAIETCVRDGLVAAMNRFNGMDLSKVD